MSRSRKESKSELFIHNLNESLFLTNEFKIRTIISYLNEFDQYLTEKSLETDIKIKEWQQSEKEKKYSGIDYYFDELINYNSSFKQLKIESTFLSSYSLFEFYFKSFTKLYKDYFELKISVEDLGGSNYINKSKLYLEKVIELNLEKLNSQWNEITKYQKIRNKIVHNNGKMNENDEKLVIQLCRIDGISIEKSGTINITDKIFIISFWDLFNEYIEGIIKLTIDKVKKTPITRRTE